MEYNKSGYDPKIHHRRSIRLKGYDYSKEGLYFITICCQNRICRFGKIVSHVGAHPCGRPLENPIAPTMILNDTGKMVNEQWLAMIKRFPNIALHDYVIMPNHFHSILEILGDGGIQTGRPQGYAPTDTDLSVIQNNDWRPTKHKTIGDMMDAFKSIVTVEYIRGVKNMGWDRFDGKLLQRDYYEHIIRDEQSYDHISDYIITNPAKWKEDKFYNE